MTLDSCADAHLAIPHRFGLILPFSLVVAAGAGCGRQEDSPKSSSKPLPSTTSSTPVGLDEAGPRLPDPPAASSSSAAPCKPDSPWQSIDAGPFAFTLPCDMEQKPVQSIDSKAARYDSPSLSLTYDYGLYSSDLREFKEEPSLREESSTVGGKPARIVTVRSAATDDERPYIAAVAFASVGAATSAQKLRLTMQAHGKTAADQETAKRIFRSIQFK